MVLKGPLKKQGPIKLKAAIPTHNITYGELCSSSTMTYRFSLAQNIICLSQLLWSIVHPLMNRSSKWDVVFGNAFKSTHVPQHQFMSMSDS